MMYCREWYMQNHPTGMSNLDICKTRPVVKNYFLDLS